MLETAQFIAKLGPSGIAVLVVLFLFFVVWPYLQKSYLPGKIAAANKAADAQTRLADVVDRMDLRLAAVEQQTARIDRDIAVLVDRRFSPNRLDATKDAATIGALRGSRA